MGSFQLAMAILLDIKYIVVLLAIILVVIKILRIGRRPAGYPPGPPTIPILGNIHQMPQKDDHPKFHEWAQQYGPIYSLITGAKTTIVLSSDTAIKDLLDKRSDIYSDRLDLYLGQTLCSGGLRVLMMNYGTTWRMIRKTHHKLLNVNAVKTLEPYQVLESKQLLADLIQDPDNFHQHLRRYTNSLTTTMTFGWRSPIYGNCHVQQLFEIFSEFLAIAHTATAGITEFFPLLRGLPDFLLPTQKAAKDLHIREKDLYMTHWMNAKEAIRDGTSQPCFCVQHAEEQEEQGFSDDLACYISGTLLEAGSDSRHIVWLYPGDGALSGSSSGWSGGTGCVDRLRASTKYVRYTTSPVYPRDDEYLGFHIPKGATIVNNVYSIHNDPRRYPDPRRFDPERFKDDEQSAFDAAVNPDVAMRDHFTFGAGRRICPGMHIAERSLFLGIARILWAFEIRRAKDSKGNILLPDPSRLTPAFACEPMPYAAEIRPRSKERAEKILREWAETKNALLDPVTKQWKKIPDGVALADLKV